MAELPSPTPPPAQPTALSAADAKAEEAAERKPAVRRQERGSLFSRMHFGGGSSSAEAPAPAAAPPPPAQHELNMEAMSEQLAAVTSCMQTEMQARVAAEAQLEGTREQVQGLLKHLHEMETVRQEEAATLAALRGLLAQIQGENAGLKEQNAALLGQCRSLTLGKAKSGR